MKDSGDIPAGSMAYIGLDLAYDEWAAAGEHTVYEGWCDPGGKPAATGQRTVLNVDAGGCWTPVSPSEQHIYICESTYV